MTRKHIFGVAVVAAGAMFIGGANANAAAIGVLSELSSDETDPELLDARMIFEVAGSTLTLTVHNDTASPSAYNITEVFFNATEDVSGLSLDSASQTGWSLGSPANAPGFGTFDFSIAKGGNPNDTIGAGESVVFTLSFTGTGGEDDFTSEFSEVPPGQTALLAAKFQSGPDDDSATGAIITTTRIIPTPGALALAGLAGLGLARRRR